MCSCTPGRYRASQARFRTISRPAKPALPLPPALQTLPVRAQPPTPVLPLHRTQVPTPGQTNLLVTTRILRTQHGTESTHRPAGPPPPAAPSRICLPTDSTAGRRSRPPLPVPLCLSCPSSSASSACLVSTVVICAKRAMKKNKSVPMHPSSGKPRRHCDGAHAFTLVVKSGTDTNAQG